MTSRSGGGAHARGAAPRAMLWACLAALAASWPSRAAAEPEAPGRRLSAVTARLVPYDVDGATMVALGELGELSRSLDAGVAQRASFLRSAAATELYVYALTAGDDAALAQLARALRLTPVELPVGLARTYEEVVAGPHRREAAPYRAVAACASRAADRTCAARLRRIADAGGAASAAARLLLLRPTVAALRAHRGEGAVAALAALVEPTCAAPSSPAVVSACVAARQRAGDETAAAVAVMLQAFADLAALEQLGGGADPFAALVAPIAGRARTDLGGMTLPLRTTAADLEAGDAVPVLAGATAAPPFELLVVSAARGASVALAPAVAIRGEAPSRLDHQAALALPGTRILAAPFRFRPVLRPLDDVVRALTDLRSRAVALTGTLGEARPAWLDDAGRTLGVIADRDLTYLDLARFVLSARQAGYERFAIVGRRTGGELVALPVEVARLEDPLPPESVRISVSAGGVRLSRAGRPVVELERGDPGLGPAASRLLAGDAPAIAITVAQPWLAQGWVLSVADAIAAAAPGRPPRFTLVLPP